MKVMKGLFLDDERSPSDVTWVKYPEGSIEWTVVRNRKDFFKELLNCEFAIISFDHDLAIFENSIREWTGYDALKETVILVMCGDLAQLPHCEFHTQNIVGKKNMESYYKNFLKNS